MKTSVIQTSFTSGELSPRLVGRTDLEKYYNGAELQENLISLPQGGLTRRGGTNYVGDALYPTQKARLVSFEFSKTQAYILEFGHLYIRIYLNQAILNIGPFDDVFDDPFETPAAHLVITPYLESELFELQFAQSADVLYITHPNHRPRTLTRTTTTTWPFAEFFPQDGPYLPLNQDGTLTITPSATTGTITLTASSDLFESGHVGTNWRIETGWVQITIYTSATVVTALVVGTLPGVGATSDWSEGAWSGVRGYPATVTFYEQRLFFAGTSFEPQAIYASQSADYPNFKVGTADSDALAYTIATGTVNAIQWVSSGDVLSVGTIGGIHVVSGTNRDDALTPTNVKVTQRVRYGCAFIAPIRIADIALFVQRGKERVRQFSFEFETDSYVTPDVTIFSNHITKDGVTQMAYQQDPESRIWLTRDDGTLICLSYEKDHQVTAWHRHILGGTSDASGTQAKVESVAVIPSATDESVNEVWVITQRYVNGTTVRHIEVMTAGHKDGGDIEDAFFVDSGLTYSGAAATVLTGLDHLEGETVQILSNGATHSDKVVSGGSITLDSPTTKAHVGLHKAAKVIPVSIDVEGNGTSQGKTKRIPRVIARFFETVGAEFGYPDESVMDNIPFRETGAPMDAAIPLFTGDKVISLTNRFDRRPTYMIRQNNPLPMTLLAVIQDINVGIK